MKKRTFEFSTDIIKPFSILHIDHGSKNLINQLLKAVPKMAQITGFLICHLFLII